METKQEVDKLRNEAEQAELDAVQMASLREKQKAEQVPQQPAPSLAPNNHDGQLGGPPTSGYGLETVPQAAADPSTMGGPSGYVPPGGGYGQPMAGYGQARPPALDPSQNVYGGFQTGGFAAGVMGGGGGGGFDLPSPDQFPSQNGAYSNNPF